jgi:hypothetical protein
MRKVLVHNENSSFGTIEYYHVTNSEKHNSASLYAMIDSNGVKIFYSFYPGEIRKTKANEKNVKYSLSFKDAKVNNGTRPESFFQDPTFFQAFSSLDSLVFIKAEALGNPLNLQIQNWRDGQSFGIEIYYHHGWPKGAKFKPL